MPVGSVVSVHKNPLEVGVEASQGLHQKRGSGRGERGRGQPPPLCPGGLHTAARGACTRVACTPHCLALQNVLITR